MICAIMQPTYFPWLGEFDLMDAVDTYVFYDDVQVVKRNWDVRNRIKTANGELYLSIPIRKTKSRDETMFNNAALNDEEKWRLKHIRSIESTYAKAPFFSEVYPIIKQLILNDKGILADYNINIIETIADIIGISTKFIRSSSLNTSEGKKDYRLVNICKEIEANEYLSPQGSAAYIELDTPGGLFPKNNIELYYRNYEHPEYKQMNEPFLPFMCILDLLFNVGFEQCLAVIKSGRKAPINYSDYRKTLKLD